MDNTKSSGWQAWLVTAGLLLIVAGVLLPILGMGLSVYRWIYAAGAAVCLVGRLFSRVPDNVPLRVKRLMRIESWSAIFFCAGAFFMFWPGAGAGDWLAFILAGGAILIYTSIMIPRAMRKG